MTIHSEISTADQTAAVVAPHRLVTAVFSSAGVPGGRAPVDSFPLEAEK